MSDIPDYCSLQEHLDRQAVGFPATSAGAELLVPAEAVHAGRGAPGAESQLQARLY